MGILVIPPTKTLDEIKSIAEEFVNANQGLTLSEPVILREGLIWYQQELENDQ